MTLHRAHTDPELSDTARKNILEPDLKRVGIVVFHGSRFTLTDEEVEGGVEARRHTLFGPYRDYRRRRTSTRIARMCIV